MKILQTTQKNMEFGGLIRDQSAFNNTQLRTFFISAVFLTLQIVYPLHVANTPRQYLDSIFMTAAGYLIFISFMSIALKTTEVFNFIDDLEQRINDSKRCF